MASGNVRILLVRICLVLVMGECAALVLVATVAINKDVATERLLILCYALLIYGFVRIFCFRMTYLVLSSWASLLGV